MTVFIETELLVETMLISVGSAGGLDVSRDGGVSVAFCVIFEAPVRNEAEIAVMAL